jgi:hypothetical protein
MTAAAAAAVSQMTEKAASRCHFHCHVVPTFQIIYRAHNTNINSSVRNETNLKQKSKSS